MRTRKPRSSASVRLLEAGVYGNPHSVNPTSAASAELVERARASVLRFFRASPEEYVAIFTPNATGALRLVGEAYPFHVGDRFLLTFDNHNSVNGIREFARARGAETTYLPSVPPDLRVDEELLPRYLTDTAGDHHNLFAYPAQSDFSGVHHPWNGSSWRNRTAGTCCSTPPPTSHHRVDLNRWRRALRGRHVNYLNLPAVEIGLQFLERIGIEAIHARVSALGAGLLDALGSLRHTDGSPAATIYGPRSWQRRGATIAFNFLHPDGRVIDERYVDRVARQHNVSLRTGCFCNPGAGEVAFTISGETLLGGELGSYSDGRACWTASRIAAAVTCAASAPMAASCHDARTPGAAGGSDPDAMQKTTSPSTGVNAGLTARAIPALAIRARIAQLRLSSEASVQTHASVVLPATCCDSSSGGSGICASSSMVLTSSPRSPRGAPSSSPSLPITSPNALAIAIAATSSPLASARVA